MVGYWQKYRKKTNEPGLDFLIDVPIDRDPPVFSIQRSPDELCDLFCVSEGDSEEPVSDRAVGGAVRPGHAYTKSRSCPVSQACCGEIHEKSEFRSWKE